MKGTLQGGSVKTLFRGTIRAEAVAARKDTASEARHDLETSEAIMEETVGCRQRMLTMHTRKTREETH